MALLLFWLLATALSAAGQGLLLPAIRRTPPGPEARQQSFALHVLLLASWACPLLLLPESWPAALAARAGAFDPVLNLCAGRPALEIGHTAATDRFLRWGAFKAKITPELLRGGLGLLIAAAAGWYYLRM